MGYTIGGRIVEFEELPTDEKICVLLQAVNQLEYSIRKLGNKVDKLSVYAQLGEGYSTAKCCPVCGKGSAFIVYDRVQYIKPETVNLRFCGGCRFCVDFDQSYVFGPTKNSVLDQWNAKSREG